VITTLNLDLQKIVEKMTKHYLEKKGEYGIHNAAVMLADTRNCEIKALMGSGDYFNSKIHGQINGTRAKRSPGSTLKPFIYALAMDQGLIHPYTVLQDTPQSFSDYNPENFDKEFLGPLKAKEALILSRNIPAIHLAQQLKNPSLYQFLQHSSINLKPENFYGLSLVLGSAEMTMEELLSLYTMLANRGVWRPLSMQKKALPISEKRLLSPEASFLTLDMLRQTSRPSLNPISSEHQLPVCWKTGTSSGYRDGWTVGVFGPYVLGVWIGSFTNEGHPSFIGATEAAPLFFNIVEAINQYAGPLTDLVKATPDMNLTKVEVCDATGLLPSCHCANLVKTWFIPGKSPIKKDTFHCLKVFSQQDKLIKETQGLAPKILSPKKDFVYTLSLSKPDQEMIFCATGDVDVTKLYWFVNHDYIGQTERDKPLTWQAKAGSFLLRVVDNQGRSAVQKLTVELIK
jgi:penicillin-binding protein 1C